MRRSIAAALLGAAACYGVLAITEPPGPGLDPDTMSYVGAAVSLVRQHALRIPSASVFDADSTSALGHFPPGFSIAIAVPTALGAPPVQAARGIMAASAFVTVALAVWLVGAVAGVGAGVVTGLALLVTPSFAFDHWQVISEPLCLALLMATLALMTRSGRPWTYGLTAAAAGLVRYAAVSATGAVVLWAWGAQGGSRIARLRRAAVAAAPSVVLQILWTLRTATEAGELRRFGLRGSLGPSFRELAGTLGGWLAPSVPPGWPQAVAAVAVALGVATLAARALGPRPADAGSPVTRLVAAAGVLALCYAALVLFSRLFVDLTIPFDQRLLSPFIVLVEVAAAAVLGAAWRRWRGRARVAVGAAAAAWLALSGLATVRAVSDALDGGWGYSGDEWRASRLGEWLRGPGRDYALFSNNTATVYFLTGRPSRSLPESLEADSVTRFGAALREQHGVVVRFPFDLEAGASPDSLANRLGLIEMARFPEGVAWAPAGRVSRPGGG